MTDLRPPHPLWGSTLDSIEIDLLRLGAKLELHREDSTSEPRFSAHTLRFESVSDLRFFNEVPEPWNYAEITEIRSTRLTPGQIKVEIMLWSEEAGITVTAGRVLFDGDDGERYLTDNAFAWERHPAL